MPQLREIPGSERSTPAGVALSPALRDEPIVVSVYLKPDDVVTASVYRDVDPRTALRAAREAAHADDVRQLTAFATANGLKVAEVDVARRLVLSGDTSTGPIVGTRCPRCSSSSTH